MILINRNRLLNWKYGGSKINRYYDFIWKITSKEVSTNLIRYNIVYKQKHVDLQSIFHHGYMYESFIFRKTDDQNIAERMEKLIHIRHYS
jgi:hypothetical protein